MTDTVYSQESSDVRAFLAHIVEGRTHDESTLAQEAGAVLDAYAERLKTKDVPAASIRPARYAMAVVIDNAVCDLPSLRTSAWRAAAHSHVFERRTVTLDDLSQYAETARKQGKEFAPLAAFLSDTITNIETQRQSQTGLSHGPAVVFGLGVLGLLVSLAAYAGFLDYRYHTDLLQAFETRLAGFAEEKTPERLSEVAQLHSEVARASALAPLSRLVTIPTWTSGPKVEEIYRTEVNAVLPDALREAIGEAIATEGDSTALYDSLRAWSILTGRSEWAPGFLTGWVETRAASLGIGSLAEHMAYLDGPEPRLAVPDDELMAQARQFASEASEVDRAFLELLRLKEMRALGQWLPIERIAEIEDVFVLRTGKPLAKGLPRALAAQGWEMASGGKVNDAILIARVEAAKLFAAPAQTSPQSRKGVLDKLQSVSISRWKDWLEDLRVQPFADGKSARLVSGALSRPNSSLDQIIENVWSEVGGDDPTRPVENKKQIDATFGPMISYIRSGKISELSSLFASLNVALSTIDLNEERGIDALMNLQERARSVVALREAPPLVAQIAEDVLAQTSAVHAQVLTNPLTREWQARVYPLCQRAIDGVYPFNNGQDVGLAPFEDFFGRRGALLRFYGQYAQRNLDTTGEKWRWSTEARLQGLSPESAEFLQRAMTVSAVFYDENQAFGTNFEIAPLAERGDVDVRLGGATVPMRPEGQQMSWPGTAPLSGMDVIFQQDGSTAQASAPGLWGFLRLMDQTTIRSRDEGRRQLVDLRVDGGRLFFEMTFSNPINPISAKSLLQGITCPPVL